MPPQGKHLKYSASNKALGVMRSTYCGALSTAALLLSGALRALLHPIAHCALLPRQRRCTFSQLTALLRGPHTAPCCTAAAAAAATVAVYTAAVAAAASTRAGSGDNDDLLLTGLRGYSAGNNESALARLRVLVRFFRDELQVDRDR
jgi:hypothetical protein